MSLDAVSMLAVWPVSSSIGPLVVFAAANGIANGAFCVTMPIAISRFVGPDQAQVAVGMALTVWSAGAFLGAPIAGNLISATGAASANSIVTYRAATFYCGGSCPYRLP